MGLKLIEDREFERDYELDDDGREITIVFDEWDYTFSFRENGERIGDEFVFIDESGNEEKYLLARMFSPFPGSGIGQAVLEMFIDITGASIYTRRNDGIVRDDGSNLIDGAPRFVAKMQKLGLIEEWD
ncbi:hypothetical protein LY01_02869 [Nonlabens xylanidelens]|uniref:N-acetyltransferase domain-containing protein n=1 Tax=Nonlabens xylanidelens TaxID=191564 RepID=A0A2S6IF11_9FLAO|nr:hypothetical protein [Nonlabens xylanidelens]PPK92783.1 hypothetical protein LY01_02869 [Nonlabens xylanidelens]PQJ19827.1 hypothetical protein BST94_06180 [Nonlabens xylanidelens]